MTPQLADAVERTPMDGHDGRSGGRLERVVLADGTRLIVKHCTPDTDLTMRVTNDTTGRELGLWQTGVLDQLPGCIGHTIVDGWIDGDAVVTVMRDVSDDVVGWTRRLSRDEWRFLHESLTRMHRDFAPRHVDGLCSLDQRVGILTPRVMSRVDNPLRASVERGWSLFAEIVPAATRDPILNLVADPGPLVAALGARPSTMLHGDVFLPNIALSEGIVTLLDWGLVTRGPAELEWMGFIAGNVSHVDATADEVLDDIRGAAQDEDALALTLVAAALELGWNKALDAVDHAEPAKRATEHAHLDWLLDAAAQGLALLQSHASPERL